MFAPPQSASSTHNAHCEQHSQSSCHHTTKEQTNCSGTAGVTTHRPRVDAFGCNCREKNRHCTTRNYSMYSAPVLKVSVSFLRKMWLCGYMPVPCDHRRQSLLKWHISHIMKFPVREICTAKVMGPLGQLRALREYNCKTPHPHSNLYACSMLWYTYIKFNVKAT